MVWLYHPTSLPTNKSHHHVSRRPLQARNVVRLGSRVCLCSLSRLPFSALGSGLSVSRAGRAAPACAGAQQGQNYLRAGEQLSNLGCTLGPKVLLLRPDCFTPIETSGDRPKQSDRSFWCRRSKLPVCGQGSTLKEESPRRMRVSRHAAPWAPRKDKPFD